MSGTTQDQGHGGVNQAKRMILPVIALHVVGAGMFMFPGLFVSLLFGVAGFALLAQAFQHTRQSFDTPTSRIRSARQGITELKVRAVSEDGKPLVAPLAGEPAAYWRLMAWKEVSTRHNLKKTALNLVASTCSHGHLMAVEDGTGICYVALADAVMHPRPHGRYAGAEELAAVRGLFHESARVKLDEPGRWWLEERWIPDTELYALGYFETIASNRLPFRKDWGAQLLRQRAVRSQGTLDMAKSMVEERERRFAERDRAWVALMRRLEGIGPNEPLGGTVLVHTLDNMEMPGEMLRPVVLSHRSERAIALKSFFKNMAASVLCFSIIIAFVLLVDPEKLSSFERSVLAMIGLS